MQDSTIRHEAVTGSGDFELKSMLSMIIRRRWIILGIALPIFLVSAMVTLRSTEQATAGTRLMLVGRQPETPEFSRAATNWDLEMSSAAQVVMSLPVAKLAAEAIFDSLKVHVPEAPGFPQFESIGEIKASVVNNVECLQVGESNILNITYSHISPEYALMVVKNISTAYIAFSIKSLQNMPAVEYYSDQIDNLHVEIDSLLIRRAAIVNAAGMQSITGNLTAAVGQIQALETDMLRYRSDRKALEVRLSGIEKALLDDPTYIPSTDNGQSSFFNTLKIRADKLVTKLADARSQYKEDSNYIVVKERQLAEIWKELDRERTNFMRDIEIRIDELSGREQALMNAILEQEAELEGYPDIQRRVETFDMQIRSQLELLKTLELKRGEVKLSAGADMRISNIYPLDEPAIRVSMVGSKKTLYLMMATILAMLLGLIAGWFVDNQDHRIYDRAQAVQSLDVPVLGAISSDRSNEGT